LAATTGDLARPAAAPAVALGAAVAYAAGVVAIDPFKTHIVGCPFHRLTGGWCPGCGSSRAVDLLLHGHVTSSLSYNVLVVPALLALAYWWSGWAVAAWTGQRPAWLRSPTELPRWAVLVIGLCPLVFMALRNTSAFSYLAPG
jgi:hypothetical protein